MICILWHCFCNVNDAHYGDFSTLLQLRDRPEIRHVISHDGKLSIQTGVALYILLSLSTSTQFAVSIQHIQPFLRANFPMFAQKLYRVLYRRSR